MTKQAPALIKRRDIIIILIALLIALAWIFLPKASSDGNSYTISVDGEAVKTGSLSEDGTFTLDGLENVVFEVKNGAVRIAQTDCAGQNCAHTGYINSPSQSIICLPKKLAVTVSSEQGDELVIVG